MAHVKRRDYENHFDSEHKLTDLRLNLEERLKRQHVATSTHHPRTLPENICQDIVRRYSYGWDGSYKVGNGTIFTFVRL